MFNRQFPIAPVQHYSVGGGLFAGEYPGAYDDDEAAVTRIGQLTRQGITTFIDLTTAEDAARGLSAYDHLLEDAKTTDGKDLHHHRFAIPDMGAPDGPEIMRGVLDLIQSEVDAGRKVYVHCWGGIGRTGTAVACWLVENGATPDEALAQVQALYDANMSPEKRARYPHSPQAASQVAYVRDWERFRRQNQATTPPQTAE